MIHTSNLTFQQQCTKWLDWALLRHWMELVQVTVVLSWIGALLSAINLMQLRNVATFLAVRLETLQLWILLPQSRWQ